MNASALDASDAAARWPSPWRAALILALAGLLLLVAGEAVQILRLNAGHFGFSMDDPYIHLALSENIARGHYGVNLNEPSSPSSSILWPFLLVPLAGSAAAVWAIVVLNTLFAALTLVLVWRSLVKGLGEPVARQPGLGAQCLLAAVLLTFAVGTNLIPLIFTGLEHSLQVLCCVAVVAGLFEESDTGRAPAWLWLALVLAPTVRYECVGVVAPALLYLLWRGHRLGAVLAGVLIAAVLGAFSAYLMRQGLPWLPNSIMAKLHMTGQGGGGRVAILRENLQSDRGALLSVGILMLVYQAQRTGQLASRRGLAAAMALAGFIHLLFGRNGWYARYEDYIVASVLLAAVWFCRDRVRQAWASAGLRPAGAMALMVLALLMLASPYLYTLSTTPAAARNVYLQQYQMHRFVQEFYRKPVAINDLGWVAYQNDEPVLDLYGLASTEALQARYSRQDPQWMARLTERHHTRLAMLYDVWFPDMPAQWVRVGRLVTAGKQVIVPKMEVAFMATDCAEWRSLVPQLRAFAKTLPEGASFEFDAAAVDRCAPQPVALN